MNPDELEPFRSPYDKIEPENLVRVNSDVLEDDKKIISSIHVTRGFTNIAIATLFKRIADECRKQKWTYLEQRELELFTMRLLRGSVNMSDGAELREAVRRDVAGGAEGGSHTAEGNPNLEPDRSSNQASVPPNRKRNVSKRKSS
jgi:hypothetical protein